MKVKSSPSMNGGSEVGFGSGMDREGNGATLRLFRSPMKSSGGGIKVPGGGGGAMAGGGGGAMAGGGGTEIPSSSRSGTDITDPLDK